MKKPPPPPPVPAPRVARSHAAPPVLQPRASALAPPAIQPKVVTGGQQRLAPAPPTAQRWTPTPVAPPVVVQAKPNPTRPAAMPPAAPKPNPPRLVPPKLIPPKAVPLQRAAPPGARHGSPARVVQCYKQTIVQHGGMSGDQFQVAAALQLDPELRLILIGEQSPNPQDKSKSIYDFYTRVAGIDEQRIVAFKVGGKMEARVKSILKAQHEDFFDQNTASVGQATNILREVFQKNNRTGEIRGAWLKNADLTDKEFEQIVNRWRVPLLKPMVVLWSRQSGALGGLHPEHDSSYTAMQQLIEEFALKDCSIMIVGDDPGGKIANSVGRYRQALRLGEFWNKAEFHGKSRGAQFAFFEKLRQLVPTLTHIGMRSGNLEAYAYMGHRVIFLEEKDRVDALRMDKLIGIETHLKYGSVKLSQLPTRTGQSLMTVAVKTQMGLRINYYKKLFKKHYNDFDVPKKPGPTGDIARANTLMKYMAALDNAKESPFQKDLKIYRWLKTHDGPFQLTVMTLAKGLAPGDKNQIVEAQQYMFMAKALFHEVKALYPNIDDVD